MHSFRLYVDVVPIGKGRARHCQIGGFTRTFTPKKTRDYEDVIRVECGKQMKFLNRQPLTSKIKAFVYAAMPIPKSSTKRRLAEIKADPAHISKPDIDNIIKAVFDGMNKVVYKDDCLIYDLRVIKKYSEKPGLTIILFGK